MQWGGKGFSHPRACFMLHEGYACIRAHHRWPPVPYRRRIDLGREGRAQRCPSGCARAGRSITSGRSRGDAHDRHPSGRRCRSVAVGRRAVGSGRAHQSGLRCGRGQIRALHRRDGFGRSSSACLLARAEEGPVCISRRELAAGVVLAGESLQEPERDSRVLLE